MLRREEGPSGGEGMGSAPRGKGGEGPWEEHRDGIRKRGDYGGATYLFRIPQFTLSNNSA